MAELARLPPDIHHLVTKFSNPKLYLLWYYRPDGSDIPAVFGIYTNLDICVMNLLSCLYNVYQNYESIYKRFTYQHIYTNQGWCYHYPEISSIYRSAPVISDIDHFYITTVESNQFFDSSPNGQKYIRILGNKLVITHRDYPIYNRISWERYGYLIVPKDGIFDDPNVEVLVMNHPAFTSFHFITKDQYSLDSPLTMVLLWIRGIHPDTPEHIIKKYLLELERVKGEKVIPM